MMKHLKSTCILSLTFLISIIPFITSAETILMFVSHENTYYSEYIVMKTALEAAGYDVEVRSASEMDFSIYMVPDGTTIEETANTLSGSSYSQFQQQFQSLFGTPWDVSLNAMPASLPVTGAIQNVNDLSAYAGLVIAGGTGALDYRIDGDYPSQGTNERFLPTETIQAAAEKLNELALLALASGKPVMAQCHGASIPAFWRIPGTSGAGMEALGYSLIKGQAATGYPEPDTEPTLTDLGISFKSNDRVTVTSSHKSFEGASMAKDRIITTRDWYPQTVAFAARTFINILETYPSEEDLKSEITILIIHGGPLDESNCAASNKENDVPCNYGGGDNLPADYSDLSAVFQSTEFNFSVTDLDLTNQTALPFSPDSESSVREYLEDYQVVVFFKHWSTYLTDEIQLALRDYVDDGHGLIGIHHALYNDIHQEQSKDVLTNLFGAESSASGWSANLTNYNVYSTNYGHFISTYGIDYPQTASHPGLWSENNLPNAANSGYSTLPLFSIYDEVYNNMSFLPGTSIGRGPNQVSPLFSNDLSPASQCHTTGFTKVYNQDGNEKSGHIVYLQAGERKENISAGSIEGQIIRNAALWAAGLSDGAAPGNSSVLNTNNTTMDLTKVFPNPTNDIINLDTRISAVKVFDLSGKKLSIPFSGEKLDMQSLCPGVYTIFLYDENHHLIDRQKVVRK